MIRPNNFFSLFYSRNKYIQPDQNMMAPELSGIRMNSSFEVPSYNFCQGFRYEQTFEIKNCSYLNTWQKLYFGRAVKEITHKD